ncbi:MAG: hypothetical protein ASARMPRED_007953, partial [Alectoria sarmentosa]
SLSANSLCIPTCYRSRLSYRPLAWGMAKVYSNVSDFVLFPRDHPYMGTLDPGLDNVNNMHYQPNFLSNMHRHGDFSAQASTSYESYPPVCAYSSAPSAYFGAQNVPYEVQKGNMGRPLRRQTPSGSPSPSISHGFDHPPSTLSSASGASAQSTASSADGSPYASATHVLPFEDKWSRPPHGLGIAPGIVSSENFSQDSFPPANFENGLMLEDSKFPNYVASQNFVPAFSPRPLALDTTTGTKEITIDSILEEANSNIQKPLQLISPVSAVSGAASPTSFTRKHQTTSPPQRKSSFRSPLTPASAASRFPSRATSPHGLGDQVFLGDPIISLDNEKPPKSPQESPEHPSLIQQFDTPIAHDTTITTYPATVHAFHHLPSQTFQPPSPAASETSSQDSNRPGSARIRSGTTSPYLRTASYQPYPQSLDARRFSIASSLSRNSLDSPGSNGYGFDDDGKERTRCPHPDCGRPFKDLKAHMLTHQSERPEKCPIATCAYHQKGFARKYDKNRHTLTHYKGNMVCGFCPGSGSASEKSFNRADVFKRHLTSVHGVEQTPPNSRKKSTNSSTNKKMSTQAVDATGKCSTCSATFKNAQEFYEHLDDCVLRVVQQEEPSEAINEQHLGGVANDEAVRDTMDRHMISAETDFNLNAATFDDEEGDDNDDDYKDESSEDNQAWPAHPQGVGHAGGGNSITKSGRMSSHGKGRGMTASKGGVPLVGKGRRRRKHYPVSWGCAKDQMKMKKRVLCVYDGSRRLWKDDMMLDNDFEVRMRFGDGESYVTDLDVETVKRAEALHNATDEEKGPDESDMQQFKPHINERDAALVPE